MLFSNIRPFFILIFSFCILSGCTSNFKPVTDSMKAALSVNNVLKITPKYIRELPYASSLVSINDAKPILLILGFVDKHPIHDTYRLTWVSADKGSIITENGRIIETVGFQLNNLDALSPLGRAELPMPGETVSWEAIYDWSPGYRYNFSAQIYSDKYELELVTNDLWSQEADHISEKVIFDQLNFQFVNHFWLSRKTKNTNPSVIKSIQYLGPSMDKVEMVIMKRFVEPALTVTEELAK